MKKPNFLCFSKKPQEATRATALEGPADFETAISAIKYGKFHYWVLVIAIPCALAIQFESTLMAFVGPVAHCDLNLSLEDKGVLNSMPFTGMLLSGFLWGYFLDLLGRKKLLCIGCSVEAAITVTCSFSQTFWFLAMMKFFGGCISGGLYVSMVTYLSEFHSKQHRGRIQLYIGSLFGMTNIVIPLLSALFLPLDVYLVIGNLEIHAWNLMLFASSLASLTSAIAFIFLPETPKFLMTKGKNEKAMQVFRRCYALNTGDDENNYPILKLIDETVQVSNEKKEKKSAAQHIVHAWQQISPLFGKSCGPKLVLLCIIQCIQATSMNTLRLWLPQILQATKDYELTHIGESQPLCEIIKTLKPNSTDSSCSVNLDNNFTIYFNLIIIATFMIISYSLASTFINWLGRKPLLLILGTTSSIAMVCLYFSINTVTTLTFSTFVLSCSGVFFDITLSVAVVVFPTSLRAMALSIVMLCGRSLSIVGNIVYPYLLQAGCAPPYFTFGGLLAVSAGLTTLLPNTDNKNLE